MRNYSRNNKGFTLIELLVVIAIISLLSSVVLASLNSARNKVKDAAIKEEVYQLSSLMALNYSDYGDYCNLQVGWVNINGNCSTAFSGTYATKAQQICNNIYNNVNYDPLYRIYTGGTTIGCATTWSWMIPLNNGNWYCRGSSGANGEYPTYYYNHPGCWDTP